MGNEETTVDHDEITEAEELTADQHAIMQLSDDMDKLNAKTYESLSKIELGQETTNQHLEDTMMQFKSLNETYLETRGEVAWLRKRLASLLPEPRNCVCGAKLIKASKKCACGHQN